MMSEPKGPQVRCVECDNFQPSCSSMHGLGRCGSGQNHDGFVGQWPFKRHKQCKSFVAIGDKARESKQ